MSYQFNTSLTYAEESDHNDPLRAYRGCFVVAEPDVIYLDGNSLGRLTLASQERIGHLVGHEWGTRLIRSWNESWYENPATTAEMISRLIGASPEEVCVADSTSVNLYKLAHAAIRHKTGRRKIISDVFNFPTDLYVLQGLISQSGQGHTLELIGTDDGICPSMTELKNRIDEDTALVVLSMVAFKSGYLYDIDEVTRIAHSRGAMILWDLSHATGAVPIDLHRSNADLAIGCTYKYLNGGPGAPAFLYVRNDLIPELESPVWGWFGDKDPFSFNLDYRPARGIRKFMVGTPPIMSLAAIGPAVNVTLSAGIDRIREKSIRQTEYLVYLFREFLEPVGFTLGSPPDFNRRGSHVSLRHPEGYRISKAMINPKDSDYRVIPDFREPDNIRLGIAPLYNSFEDIYRAILLIRRIVDEKWYGQINPDREKVT